MIKKIMILMFAAILFGCDSGSSSSGSSATVTDSNPTSPENIGAQYAGTYNGTLEATYTATELGISDSESTPIVIEIQSNGNTTVTVEGRTYSGSLDTDTITAVVNVNETYEDITCTGTVNINAKLSGNSINGTANGSGNCTQGALSTPVLVAGVLNASK